MKIEITKHPKFTATQTAIIEALNVSLGCNVEVFYSPNVNVVYKQIEAVVLREYDVTTEQLFSKSHKRTFADVRHVLIYLVKSFLPLSNTEIAELVDRDRSTIIHSFKKVDNLMSVDEEFCIRVTNCINELKQQ